MRHLLAVFVVIGMSFTESYVDMMCSVAIDMSTDIDKGSFATPGQAGWGTDSRCCLRLGARRCVDSLWCMQASGAMHGSCELMSCYWSVVSMFTTLKASLD